MGASTVASKRRPSRHSCASSSLSVRAALPTNPTPCNGFVFGSRGFIGISRWRAYRSLKRRTVGSALPAPSSTTTEFVTVEIQAARRSDTLTVRLDDDDRHAITALPKNQRFVTPPFVPEWDA
jgi:hypothetical protein